MVFEKSCGAIVFRNGMSLEGERCRYVLMIKQSSRSNFSFPKGHVENGETEVETAEREVFEETAVKIKIKDNFRSHVYYNPRPGARKEVVYFVAETDASEIRPQEGEISEVEWIDVDNAPALLAHSNDRRVLSRALEHINKKNVL